MRERFFIFAIVLLCGYSITFGTTEQKATLHPVMKMELNRLDELWNVLDQVAAKVWPDWTGYADVPFLFVKVS